jgi:hypothetical protein
MAVYFEYDDNCDLLLESLPISITHLDFGMMFNGPVDSLNILEQLQNLKFGDQFNHQVNFLLTNLTHLILGLDLNQYIHNLRTLLNLILGDNFNFYVK